jgi:hypothetical protein
MFKLFAKSFSLAPLPYLLSLTASIVRKRSGHSGVGLAVPVPRLRARTLMPA